MIRRAHNLGPLDTDPSPDEIRQRSAEIRKTWTPRERARRAMFKRAVWMPPSFCEQDLASFLSTDFEQRG